MSLQAILYGLPLTDWIMLAPIIFAFGGSSPKPPPPPPPAPQRTDPDIQAMRARARLAARNRRGRASTILGGEGLRRSELRPEADQAQKELLGG